MISNNGRSWTRAYTVTTFEGFSPAREPVYFKEEVPYTELFPSYVFGTGMPERLRKEFYRDLHSSHVEAFWSFNAFDDDLPF